MPDRTRWSATATPFRDLGVVAYLGMPLALPDGHVIGALCAIDTVPRSWTAAELETVADLAAVTWTRSRCGS